MKTYPLTSLTLEEAMELQFKLVDCVTQEFKGSDILNCGDLGLAQGLNRPQTTYKVEQVLQNFFKAEEAMLVRGAGTNALRLALYATARCGGKLLVHHAPIYPTTKISLKMLSIEIVQADYNNLEATLEILIKEKPCAILIQVTRQKPNDSYDLKELITAIRKVSTCPIVTDDNYAALKTTYLGCQVGASLSTFSTFKLLGPEGVGLVVGDVKYIEKLRAENYSGGGQVQGHEALAVLKGFIYAPVALAISAKVCDQVLEELTLHPLKEIEEVFIVNAQSKVLIVKLKEPVTKQVLNKAETLGALPYPVGAESQYEFSPLFYRVSSTFREMDKEAEEKMIRINPNRAGKETILRILKEAIHLAHQERGR